MSVSSLVTKNEMPPSKIGKDWAVERRTDRVDSDCHLPEEVIEIRNRARELADEVLRPVAHEVNCAEEHRDGFRHDIFQAIAKSGLYGVPFKKDVGGMGLKYPVSATMAVVEELAYYSPGVACAMYDGPAILGATTIDHAGGAIRQKWIPKIISGEIVTGFATSEPAASTDLSPQSIQTTAVKVSGGWKLNGTKRWITNSVAADRTSILCLCDGHVSVLWVDMHAEGVSVSDPDIKMGNKPQLTAEIYLKDVFVPDEDVVGEIGKGLRVMLGSLSRGRLGVSAVGVGMAQRAMDVACAYSSERHVFGQPIASMQHWQYRLADRAVDIEMTRTLYQKAALNADTGGEIEPLAAMSKLRGSELAVDVVRDAIQACGGYGFVRELKGPQETWPLESIYRDAKIGEIYEGANEVQKWLIARNLLGRDITG